MTPTSRDELIEVMARAIWREKLQGYDVCGQSDVCRAWPCACAIGLVKVALTTLEQSGCQVVPVEITDDMMGIDHSNGTWQVTRRHTAMVTANPFRSKAKETEGE